MSSRAEITVIRKLLQIYQTAIRGRRAMRKELRTASERIAELEFQHIKEVLGAENALNLWMEKLDAAGEKIGVLETENKRLAEIVDNY